ncbi:hypothetical protein GBAR_LOCUS1654 [Geodia barretti]|uniref:Uncharacterized protein n=1 Tax=Geodia barretti TaxID=519541 RepID=A0AA35QXI7_GEOBA|nr:hypothetical protein GBAR_LOCUS1654 [Geodia barretti]
MPNRRLAEDLLRDAECSKVVAGAESQLRDDREIWIIRVPRDIDVASLHGATVAMDRIEQTLPGDKKYQLAISQAPILSSKLLISDQKGIGREPNSRRQR